MEGSKQRRLLGIFFRCLHGENIIVQNLANEYGVSTKSIGRTIGDIRAFLANHRDLVGNMDLEYSKRDRCYHLHMDEFLSNREMFALVKVIIGVRAFSKEELLILTDKLKRFTSMEDRSKLNDLIRKELYHYSEVKHDCDSVQETLWKIVTCITEKKEITIDYYRADRVYRTHRIRPVSLMFTDYYFYLIAFKIDDPDKPIYFRVDRIKHITEHRKRFSLDQNHDFDEGKLRNRSLFMWPGKLRTIRFEFSGPSVQAVLDKLPTSRVIDRRGGKHILEAEVYGDGIKMWLLSQGHWVKVTAPDDFVEEFKKEISTLAEYYL